jgi:hypothetical protein
MHGGHDQRLQGGGVGQVGLAFTEGGEEAGVDVGPDAAQRSPVVGVEGLEGVEVGLLMVASTRRARPSFK